MPGRSAVRGAGGEVAMNIGGFLGTNQTDEPTHFPPGVFQVTQNWYPNPVGSLSKRPGAIIFQPVAASNGLQALVWGRDPAGNRYLYVYHEDMVLGDRIVVSLNDGAFAALPPASANPSTVGARAGFAFMNGTVYCGNGVDPIFRIPLGGAAISLAAPALADDTGQAAVLAADTASLLASGQYAYRWAIYDTGTKQWPFIGPPHMVTVQGRNNVTFTAPQAGAPATVLGPNQLWHLFVARANLPIEFGTDQTASGLAAAATFVLITVDTLSTPVPIPSTITRTGRALVPHRSRLFVGVNGTRQVTATNVLAPGFEQTLFDHADFWPANASLSLEDPNTGIGVAALTATPEQPTAPLALFTESSTWILIGDILNDPSATFFRLSGHIGCVAQETIVNTPIGLLWLGHESVYWLQSTTGEPIDLGWPITTALRTIPPTRRAFACATYHKGFYKLCVSDPGEGTNTREWWLDLRPQVRGQLLTLPSWSGPHRTGAPLVAITETESHPAEDDRAWGLQAGTGGMAMVLLLHQAGVFQDVGLPIESILQTARMNLGDPFSRKRVKRARAIGKVDVLTTIPIAVFVDEGANITNGSWTFPVVPGDVWDVAVWDTAIWSGAPKFSEGDYPLEPELLGQTVELLVQHALPSDIQLRDLEVRVQPIDRVVA